MLFQSLDGPASQQAGGINMTDAYTLDNEVLSETPLMDDVAVETTAVAPEGLRGQRLSFPRQHRPSKGFQTTLRCRAYRRRSCLYRLLVARRVHPKIETTSTFRQSSTPLCCATRWRGWLRFFEAQGVRQMRDLVLDFAQEFELSHKFGFPLNLHPQGHFKAAESGFGSE